MIVVATVVVVTSVIVCGFLSGFACSLASFGSSSCRVACSTVVCFVGLTAAAGEAEADGGESEGGDE